MKHSKRAAAMGILAVSLTLAGCHKHQWQEASCTAPQTCAECEETDGEPLGHTWTEASYSAPKTCSVCGQTEGEPLQADFETYDFTYKTETDQEYPFATKCGSSDDLTKGTVSFSDYRTFASDEEHPAQEGYEWKTVTATVTFEDENVSRYGMGGYVWGICDFYNLAPGGEEEDSIGSKDAFTVNYNGTDYTECSCETEWLTNEETEWLEKEDGTYYYKSQIRFTFRLPVGYDGQTVFLYNYEADHETGGSFDTIETITRCLKDENTVIFQLK